MHNDFLLLQLTDQIFRFPVRNTTSMNVILNDCLNVYYLIKELRVAVSQIRAKFQPA